MCMVCVPFCFSNCQGKNKTGKMKRACDMWDIGCASVALSAYKWRWGYLLQFGKAQDVLEISQAASRKSRLKGQAKSNMLWTCIWLARELLDKPILAIRSPVSLWGFSFYQFIINLWKRVRGKQIAKLGLPSQRFYTALRHWHSKKHIWPLTLFKALWGEFRRESCQDPGDIAGCIYTCAQCVCDHTPYGRMVFFMSEYIQ